MASSSDPSRAWPAGLLREIARVRVEAMGAVVDLRNAQIDRLNQFGGQSALRDIPTDPTEGLGTVRSELVIVQSFGYVAVPLAVI